MCYGLIFNNICTGVHVIDAIEGVYVSDANAPESNNESSGQTDNFTETLQKLTKKSLSY